MIYVQNELKDKIMIISFCLFRPKDLSNNDNWYVKNKIYTAKIKERKYFAGLYKNLEIASKLLPEWEIRVYINNSVVESTHVKRVKYYFPKVKFIEIKDEVPDIQLAMTLSRFLPLMEDAKYVLSLDLDNYINNNFLEHILLWIESKKTLFTAINQLPTISAGCFGMGPDRNRNKIKNDFRMFIESRKDFSFGVDQDFLRCIWEDYQSDYYGFTITTKNLPDVNGKIGTYTKKYKKMIK
jgi:hypothetical protein